MPEGRVPSTMHRRHVASIVAVVTLALTAGCVGALGQADGPAVDANKTVAVSATGEVTAEADQAVVRVSVVATGDDAETARQRLGENVSSLRSGLAEAGIGDDQITTSGYDIGQDRRPSERPGEGEGESQYVARQSFEITLADTDGAGSVIDVAVGSGATNVDGVQFTLSETARDEVKQEALQDAMATARQNAETLAATEDLSVGEALRITHSQTRPVPYAAEASLEADSSGGTTIDGGPVTVTASVEVIYEAN